ncbi:DNA repair protein RadA, partial [Candidatus Uhrbacteria bacterium]|nr:DNA repair protein RadA [Candidatus Uhrbacteria bacterium]
MGIQTIYICSNCDAQSLKWAGRCSECGAWGTLSESVKDTTEKKAVKASAETTIPFGEIQSATFPRIKTGISELDQVLGGGIVPGSLILLGGEPGIGKCVTGDTRLLDPATGAFLPITSWQRDKRSVASLNQQTGGIESQKISFFHNQGVQQIFEVKTRLGKSLKCTGNHPLLTPTGWKQVSKLLIGDRIASPRALPYFGNQALAEHKIKLIAYGLSDGSIGKQISVTAMIPEIQDDLKLIADQFGVSLTIHGKKNNRAKTFHFVQKKGERKRWRQLFAKILCEIRKTVKLSRAEWARKARVSYGLLNSWERGGCVPSREALERLLNAIKTDSGKDIYLLRESACEKTTVATYLESIGLRHKKAATKSVPECIFLLPRQQISLFLKILFSCDGSVYINKNDQAGISYCTISKVLAQDIQHLLLRFGFIAKLRIKKMRVANKPYTAYELQILGIIEVKRFINEIGIWGRDEAKKRLCELPDPKIPSTHRDTVPTNSFFWKTLEKINGGISYKEMSRQCGITVHTGRLTQPLTRKTVIALADTFPSEYLYKLAYNDIYWDEITEILSAGEEKTYDITVPFHANFIANDLIVHNSSILLQIAINLASEKLQASVLYCSGEESAEQIKMRYDRFCPSSREQSRDPDRNGISHLSFLGETIAEKITSTIIAEKPELAIIDSIQTISSMAVPSEAGSVAQVRACTVQFLETAKKNGIPIIITGHVTKEGMVAGPKTLEHLVDTVLYLEGDAALHFRLLKTVKNRFGSTNEIGIFEMSDTGLREVENPSEIFISKTTSSPGTVTTVVMEGSRAFLLQVQALVSKTYFGYPQRRSVGFDLNRLQLLIAVMIKRLGLNLGDQDIHINIVGGFKIAETACDLAVIASIISAYTNKTVASGTIIFGEVGLSGEVRAVSQMEKRLKEAEKLGFTKAIIPASGNKLSSKLQLQYIK